MKVQIFTCDNISNCSRGFEIVSNEINAWIDNLKINGEAIEIIDIKTNVIKPNEDDIICTASVIYK